MFDEIYIPSSVSDKILVNDESKNLGKNELRTAINNGKIKIFNIKDKDLVEKLYGKLHRGELEVIIGGKELSADYVIIDEITARNLAKVFSLTTIGTIGILRLAKKHKFIDEVKKYIFILKSNGFRISDNLISDILKKENEL